MSKKRVLVIAEAGVNHNGSVKTALDLVDAAADSGADIVKFQTFLPEDVAADWADVADYQKRHDPDLSRQRDMLSDLVLSREDWAAIRNRCESRQIEFLSTAFDRESLRLIRDLGVSRLKIPSGEVTHKRLLEAVAASRLPIILSTGMCEISDITSALEVLYGSGVQRQAVTLLHCTSAYPAPFSDLNLQAIPLLRERFKVEVGYSDHSLGAEAAIAAVALGASMIEKHITLDSGLSGPDHAASMEPHDFRIMVNMIRRVEIALGDGQKRCMPSELQVRDVARRSLIARDRIEAGSLFTESLLGATRPGTGVSPMRIDEFVGCFAERTFEPGEFIE